MTTELPCNDCNCIFSDEISFKIHLKNCLNNINKDPLNKYYCSACDRYFRFLPNLLRHGETKKHLDLINWNIKQLSNNCDSTDSQTNIKNIFLTRDIIEKENIKDINIEDIDIKEDIDIEQDFLISNTSNTSNTLNLNVEYLDIQDDFLSQLQESYNTSNITSNSILNIDNTKSNLELQINDNLNDYNLEIVNDIIPIKETKQNNNNNDDFLENLIKEREKVFNEFTKNTNNNINNNINNNTKEKKFNFDFKIETNENLNLKDELNQLKLNITNNTLNNSSSSFLNDNSNDDFLNQIQLERQKQQNLNQNIIIGQQQKQNNIPEKKTTRK